MSTLTPFGELLCSHLRQRGWSQRHFATLVGINQAQVGRIVHGQRRPPLEQLGVWSQTLGLSTTEEVELARLALLAHEADWLAGLIRPDDKRSMAAEPKKGYDQPT